MLLTKRHAMLIALFCLLISATLLGHFADAAETPAPAASTTAPATSTTNGTNPKYNRSREFALAEVNNCSSEVVLFPSDTFFSDKRQGYIVAGLKKVGAVTEDNDEWAPFVHNKDGESELVSLKDKVLKKDPADINMRARVFLESKDTVYLVYHSAEPPAAHFAIEKYKIEGKKLVLDKTCPAVNAAQFKENTPLWDVLKSKQNGIFYMPVQCEKLNGPPGKDETCEADCFMIDQYCLFDMAMNVTHPHLEDPLPSPAGGPREFYQGLAYNEIFCNSYAEVKSKEGKPTLIIRQANDVGHPICYTIDTKKGEYKQLQVWSNHWEASGINRSHCIHTNGTDLGDFRAPNHTTTVPTPPTGQPLKGGCTDDEDMKLFLIFAIVVNVLMTVTLIAFIIIHCYGWSHIYATPVPVVEKYD